MFVAKQLTVAIDFLCNLVPYYGSQCLPATLWLPTFLQTLHSTVLKALRTYSSNHIQSPDLVELPSNYLATRSWHHGSQFWMFFSSKNITRMYVCVCVCGLTSTSALHKTGFPNWTFPPPALPFSVWDILQTLKHIFLSIIIHHCPQALSSPVPNLIWDLKELSWKWICYRTGITSGQIQSTAGFF